MFERMGGRLPCDCGLLMQRMSGLWQSYEKTSTVSSAVVVVAASGATSLVSYPSVVRFVGHLQLKGLAPRTVEAYVCMTRLLAQWAACDPATLSEERVRDYFLHKRCQAFSRDKFTSTLGSTRECTRIADAEAK